MRRVVHVNVLTQTMRRGTRPCPGRLPLSLPAGSLMIRSSPHLLPEPVSRQLLRKLPKACTDYPLASGAPENCRIRLAFSLLAVFSGIFGGFPSGRAAEDLNSPFELLGGDLAPGEALPEDLLRRVSGRL